MYNNKSLWPKLLIIIACLILPTAAYGTTYSTTYAYEVQTGNLKKKISPGKTAEYEYDYENRLIRYNDGVSAVEYEYNGDGIRLSKTVNGEKTIFINDIRTPLTQVIMECTGNWYITKRYVYGRDLISQEE